MNAILAPKPPHWSGQRLEPHHLQWSDAYHEARATFGIALAAPDAWGVLNASVSVTADSVRVSRLNVRLRSGAYLRTDSGGAIERPLDTAFQGKASLEVYLGVAREASRAPNVADNAATHATRYQRDGEGNLQPYSQILFADEGAEECERLPLCRLERRGAVIAPDPWVMPPMARAFAGSSLAATLATVVEALQSRQRRLLDARRDGGAARFEEDRLPQLRLLVAINRALARLSPSELRGHPAPTFKTLVRLLGELEALGGRIDPIPNYVHEAPGPAFRALTDRLLAAIPTVARDKYVVVPFERRDANTFRAKAVNATTFRARLYLVASGMEKRSSLSMLPIHAKLAGPTHFQRIVSRSLPGVAVGAEFDAPAAIPEGANDAVFRLDQRGELWTDVVNGGELQLFVPQAPSELSFALYYAEE